MILPTAQFEFKISWIAGTSQYYLKKLNRTGNNETFDELFSLKSDSFLFGEEADCLLAGCNRKTLKHKHSKYLDFEIAFETYLHNCPIGIISSTLNTSDAMLFHEFDEGCYHVFIYEKMAGQVLQLLLSHLDSEVDVVQLNKEALRIAG